ncbi:MAG: sensor domain-containing protein [Flavobacteriales bacterium]|nr:sensor domain-containing protein [Flavobacteriales bacterium]
MKNVILFLTKKQCYSSLLYALIAFPLGLIYFIAISVIGSLGLGLLLLWVGIPLINLTFLLAKSFIHLEAWLYKSLVDRNAHISTFKSQGNIFYWSTFIQNLKGGMNWLNLVRSIFKLPLGIIMWTLSLGTITASLGLVSSFFIYLLKDQNIISGAVKIVSINGQEYVNSYLLAFLISLVGLLLFNIACYFLNFVSKQTGKVYTFSLGNG